MCLPLAPAKRTPNARLVAPLPHDGPVVLRLLMICLSMPARAREEIAGVVFYRLRTVQRWLERSA